MDIRKLYFRLRNGGQAHHLTAKLRDLPRPAPVSHDEAVERCRREYSGKSARFAEIMADCLAGYENPYHDLMPGYPVGAPLLEQIEFTMAVQDKLYHSDEGLTPDGQSRQIALTHHCQALIGEYTKQAGRDAAIRDIYQRMRASWGDARH